MLYFNTNVGATLILTPQRSVPDARLGCPPTRHLQRRRISLAYDFFCFVREPPVQDLSPRVRGSRDHRGDCGGRDRSIPRVCGGATACPYGIRARQGLSPRVRGSRHPGLARPYYEGSIPACAGEPIALMLGLCVRRVYPRVCGGAVHSGLQPKWKRPQGLSPRVRGSLRHWTGYRLRANHEVYPRVCGGAVVNSLA